MIRITSVTILFSILIWMPSCHPAKKIDTIGSTDSKTITQKNSFNKEGFTKATVIDYSAIAGCGYLLMLEDESKLQPKNLADSYKKDGLVVWIKYTIENTPNVCMTGRVIRINEIIKQ